MRAQLRVAVALALDRVGVEAERDVVDEHAPVDLGQVDAALAAVDERVERADDVVAVDAEVEREVVARARRDAGVGQVELGGDRGDDRLRAVAAGHRQPVGAAGDRVAHELLEVPRGAELDRLDPARAGLVGQREALGLAAAGLRVEEQHRPLRRRHAAAAARGRRTPPARRRTPSTSAATTSSSSSRRSLDQQRRSPRRARARRPRGPATRAAPRRRTPYQAAAAATATQASAIRPRGNSCTATTTASAEPAEAEDAGRRSPRPAARS